MKTTEGERAAIRSDLVGWAKLMPKDYTIPRLFVCALLDDIDELIAAKEKAERELERRRCLRTIICGVTVHGGGTCGHHNEDVCVHVADAHERLVECQDKLADAERGLADWRAAVLRHAADLVRLGAPDHWKDHDRDDNGVGTECVPRQQVVVVALLLRDLVTPKRTSAPATGDKTGEPTAPSSDAPSEAPLAARPRLRPPTR